MRAWVQTITNGEARLGSDHCWITNEYKGMDTLVRFVVRPFLKDFNGKVYLLLVHHNFDQTKYGTPDEAWVVRDFEDHLRLDEVACPRDGQVTKEYLFGIGLRKTLD